MAVTLENRLERALESIYISGHQLHHKQTAPGDLDAQLRFLAHNVEDAQTLRAKIAKRDALRARSAA